MLQSQHPETRNRLYKVPPIQFGSILQYYKMGNETLNGVIIRGHRVASGASPDTPYPQGSLSLQLPLFKERGADFGEVHPTTINISIEPWHFKIIKPNYFFEQANWIELHPPENFSFVKIIIALGTTPNREDSDWQPAFIYYPHSETKQTHFSSNTILETLTAYIPNVSYGEKVRVKLPSDKITVFQ